MQATAIGEEEIVDRSRNGDRLLIAAEEWTILSQNKIRKNTKEVGKITLSGLFSFYWM